MEEKTLTNVDIEGARSAVSDIQVTGNGNLFQVLCKASSKAQGWMKSTKAMAVHGGCVVQVTTQQKNPDGSYSVAEALTFVPNVQIVNDVDGGRRLIDINANNVRGLPQGGPKDTLQQASVRGSASSFSFFFQPL